MIVQVTRHVLHVVRQGEKTLKSPFVISGYGGKPLFQAGGVCAFFLWQRNISLLKNLNVDLLKEDTDQEWENVVFMDSPLTALTTGSTVVALANVAHPCS